MAAADLTFDSDPPAASPLDTPGLTTAGATEFNLPDNKLDLEALNRDIVLRALEKHGGNQTRTARYLGLTRRILQGRLKTMGGS